HFKVVNTDYAAKELSATLYRSFKVHPDPFDNTEGLKHIKTVELNQDATGHLNLSDEEIEELRKEKKNIYLALSIDFEKKPVFLSGARILAKLKNAGFFAVDLKNNSIIENYNDENVPEPPAPETQDLKSLEGHTLSEQAKDALAHREKLQQELADNLKAKLKDRKKLRHKRKEFIRKVLIENVKRRRKRSGERYVEPGVNADTARKDSIKRGMEHLNKQMLRGMAMYLTKEFLEELGIDIGKDWRDLSKEDWQKIKEKMSQKLAHKRKNRFIDDCRQAHTAQGAEDALKTDTTTTPDDTSTEESEDRPNSTLEQIFEKLCADLSSRLDTDSRPGMDDIASAVQQSIAAGPADTTAYYDFHTLAIAWEDTWTSVYDDYTERQVAKVYDEIVQLVGEDFAGEFENTEYTEMTEFLEDLSDVLEDVQNAPGRRTPTDLVAWISEIEPAWPYLSTEDQSYLRFLLNMKNLTILNPLVLGFLRARYPEWMVDSLPQNGTNMSQWCETTARNVIGRVDDEVYRDKNPSIGRLGRMMDGIHTRLYREPYDFDVFVPGSYNYGLIHTFQQKWKPLNYQVGDLISTMPLTPGEKKTYSVKHTVNSKTSSTRKQSSSLSSSRESSSSARSQADIVAKAAYNASTTATVNTNFGMTVGVFNGEGNSTSTMTGNAASESQTTKQNIRETTLKAAQEYKDERSLEVVSTVDETSEYTMTSELTNPNNEITVTY
ncbi:MAG: hypothetical protein MJA29_09460, partial [Candidatus Omnitrophica bacterium]|nr:hypothetical protein [Candidatus Omnitrophota bacterium]